MLPTGLPAGVTAAWAANTITISGTPTVAGTFNYTIPLNGGCGSVNASGTITVTAGNTVGTASSTPTVCINTAITNITHTTTSATGIGASTGLPAGVTAAWAANTITISGTPTTAGIFSYSIPLTGGCGNVNGTGTITVIAGNTAGPPSGTPTLCINTTLPNITHSTTSATGIGAPTGLPAGVTAAWAANTITISGTPTAAGVFAYTIPLTGGCGNVSATGTITVTANNTASTAPAPSTLCINTALTNITHTTTGATGIGSATGLPAGVTAAWAANTITISGTPTAAGVFNYSIPLTGGCGNINATGTITVIQSVTPSVSISATPGNSICAGTSVTFTATPTNGGSAPDYQWQVNGINAGTNNSAFTTAALVNGDIVGVIMTSNSACATPSTATSTTITMTVITTTVTPSVTIAAFPAIVCYGTNVAFTATPVNGGPSPTYQWQLNGVPVGTNSPIYTTNTLANADSINCIMTSNDICPNPAIVTSNSIIISIDPFTCPTGFYFPTAFTPNNDGKNDIFKPKLYGILLKYSMAIFNRWGQKVFETSDLNKGWDGKVSGQDVSANVYVWVSTYQLDKHPVINTKGTIVLIR